MSRATTGMFASSRNWRVSRAYVCVGEVRPKYHIPIRVLSIHVRDKNLPQALLPVDISTLIIFAGEDHW